MFLFSSRLFIFYIKGFIRGKNAQNQLSATRHPFFKLHLNIKVKTKSFYFPIITLNLLYRLSIFTKMKENMHFSFIIVNIKRDKICPGKSSPCFTYQEPYNIFSLLIFYNESSFQLAEYFPLDRKCQRLWLNEALSTQRISFKVIMVSIPKLKCTSCYRV